MQTIISKKNSEKPKKTSKSHLREMLHMVFTDRRKLTYSFMPNNYN